jgi:hypothetical protein
MSRFAVTLLLCSGVAHAGVGESAVITLVFPHSARSYAMGEVGVALADGEDALYWNPAGLGVYNARWAGGAGTWFYEPLLPAFNLPDLWHTAISVVCQPPSGEWGGVALDFNYINMGVNPYYDELGREVGAGHCRESVLAAGWGADVFSTGRHFLGLSLKYVNSALAPGIGDGSDGVGRTLAVDAGYIFVPCRTVRLACTFQNMGPSIFYISKDQSDPIPFTVSLAIGHKDTLHGPGNWPVVDLSSEVLAHREFVQRDENGQPLPFFEALFRDAGDQPWRDELAEVQWNWGGEVTFLETVSLRSGFLFDFVGERYEWHMGFGLRFLNHFQFDWGCIHSPEGMWGRYLSRVDPDKTGATGARNGQWQISLGAYDLLHWRRDDLIPFNLDKFPGFPRPGPKH